MVQPTEQSGPQPPRRDRPSVKRGLVWRVLTILAIVLATIAVAHYLKSPMRGGDGSLSSASATPGTAEDRFAAAPEPARPRDKSDPPPAVPDIRRMLAGILMAAAEEDGPYEDPANQDPESRRQFLANLFGLPTNHPRGEAPDDLVPTGGQTLVVLPGPPGENTRMTLVRMPGDIHRALSQVYQQYKAAGWQAVGDRGPEGAKTDDGWLVRFAKGNRYRIVFARPRQTVDETLIAVYDTP